MVDPVEVLLKGLWERRQTGALVNETAYYPPIEQFLSAIGSRLSPEVKCFSGLKNLGSGMPDMGLFTPDQYRRGANRPRSKQAPSRGVVEVKPPSENVRAVSKSKQVQDYLDEYCLVLVTTCREFLLLQRSDPGVTQELGFLSLAADEASFWTLVSTPRKSAGLIGPGLVNYLKLAMVYPAPITSPEQLAWLLASHAQEAKARVALAGSATLDPLKQELGEALGIKFTGAKGEDLFQSSFVQSLFYGLFSAWVLWSQTTAGRTQTAQFDWQKAAWSLQVPVIGPIYGNLTLPQSLGPLGIAENLDWATAALNRVNRTSFFARFQKDRAIQFFYEPFLEQFDPRLRKAVGVWYTPTEVVHYMVERVDSALRSELGIEDGLADRSVYVLDPCCGTGSYLVEVLRKIAQTVEARSGPGLVPAEVKDAAMTRVFGFEILPAPFVVSHLQVGLLLQELGAPLQLSSGERAAVYLTNSLTGWNPPVGPQKRLSVFFDLEHEREAASDVKRTKPVLVVLGNPPYNGFAGVSPTEEQGSVEPYKEGLREVWHIRKNSLDDLYVRFLRLAERRIAELTGRGIVCFITNYSYLGEPSFVVLRQRLLKEFDSLQFDCLNGDSRLTSKQTPTGETDPSVFSTERNPKSSIRVGTTIGLWARRRPPTKEAGVTYRDFWGKDKRANLVASLAAPPPGSPPYQAVRPIPASRFSFRPSDTSTAYYSWPEVIDLAAQRPIHGALETRGGSLISMPEDASRFKVLDDYFDPTKTNAEISQIEPRFMFSSGEFKAEPTRRLLLGKKLRFDPTKVSKYIMKPFDIRCAYLDPEIQPLFARPGPEFKQLASLGNPGFLLSRDSADRSLEGPPFYFAHSPCDYDCISGHARLFATIIDTSASPGQRRKKGAFSSSQTSSTAANISDVARTYLRGIGVPTGLSEAALGAVVWRHVLAIGFSPAYLTENGMGLKSAWPRIPLPSTWTLLNQSGTLGKVLEDLLDPDTPVGGVTSGPIRRDLSTIAVVSKRGGLPVNPGAGDFKVTAGWGHGNKVVMPGVGHSVPRPYSTVEEVAFGRDGPGPLGKTTLDIYLNDSVYWANIPTGCWEYVIGGYQVLKKWLSYREFQLLGRELSLNEVKEFTSISRRVAAILQLSPQLDSNYSLVKGSTFAWVNPPKSMPGKTQPTSKRRGFGGQVSFETGRRMKGTASLKNWKP